MIFPAFLLAGLLSLRTVLAAGHKLTITNKCDIPIRPVIYGGLWEAKEPGPPGKVWSEYTIQEPWTGGKLWAITDKTPNAAADGQGATLVECSLQSNGYSQCNISAASGFNAAVTVKFGKATLTCAYPGDPNCYDYGEHCGNRESGEGQDCLVQDNDLNAELSVTFYNCT